LVLVEVGLMDINPELTHVVYSRADWADTTPWLKDNLPKGTAHHQGMVVTLDTERDVSNFLLRWS
jgi:hypothetical protein